jgi:transposase
MWVRTNPSDDRKIALFDYDPHRSGVVAQRLFTDYQGYLQVDGYGAYNELEKQKGITRIGCNMHGRRGFEKAAKEGAKSGKSLAQQGLNYYQQLYDIEECAKESGLDWQRRHELRQAEARPLWEKFRAWAEEYSQTVPQKSKIGEAFHYFINEYQYLTGYLLDGTLEMDNGFTERVIRKFAIGRNNWLFSDTEDGAHASAMFYSFVVTAKLNGVNPYLALREIFEKIPIARTVEDYERLANLLLYPTQTA